MLPAQAGGPASSRRISYTALDLPTQVVGGVAGGLAGGSFVAGSISLLKLMMDSLSAQGTIALLMFPVLGLSMSSLLLNGVGRTGNQYSGFRRFPPGMVRADISADVVDNAGHEESFPWRLAPLRLLAIFATVGFGASMGTEAPAAYLGQAAGVALGEHKRVRWRRLLRPAALAGGAAGVSVLMGIPLLGTAYVLEMGRRNGAPYSPERVLPAAIGGFTGWVLNFGLELNLIRLVEPKEPPRTFFEAVIAALLIGALSGFITSLAASAVYRAKKWSAPPEVRVVFGGAAAIATAILVSLVAMPVAAFGPGGTAILWAEAQEHSPQRLLAVALLQAALTTAAAAAGGCGGVFVPYMAIGDLAGRVFAPGFFIGNDLAGAAGAAGGIAGGYRLPLTALVMVMGTGGPTASKLTCLAVVFVAHYFGRMNPFRGT